jgi:hypothetical protein
MPTFCYPKWATGVEQMKGTFPVVVRLWGSRVYWVKLFAWLGIATGGAYFATKSFASTDIDERTNSLIFGFLALIGIYVVVKILLERITFFETWIEFRRSTKLQELSRTELMGYRLRGDTLDLLPQDEMKETIGIPAYLRTEDRIAPWFEGIPDLDMQNLSESVRQRERLDRWRRLAVLFNGIGIIAACWGWFYPRPYSVALLAVAAMAPAAVLLNLASSRMLRFGLPPNKNDAPQTGRRHPKPTIFGWIMLPGTVLMARLILDCQLLDWWRLAEWSVGLGAIAILYGVIRDPALRYGDEAILFGVVAALYFAGLLGLIDVQADFSPAQAYPVTVISKRDSIGSGPQLFSVFVTPWGPVHENSELFVTDEYFSRLHEGERACVYEGRGRLGLAWYELGDCPISEPKH